jgi:Lar family restriction alleviation protein
MEKVKPCPFCGSKKVNFERTSNCWVRCLGCKADGPAHRERQEAIRMWNRRSKTAGLAKIIFDDEA